MESNNDIQCPQCKSFEQEISLEGKPYMQRKCPKCQAIRYNCICPYCDANVITLDPMDFADGFRIHCPNQTCKKVFQLVKCPKPGCPEILLFNNNYAFGNLLHCKKCSTTFQQVACIHCGESNYWKGDNENHCTLGDVTECYSCHGKFQLISCPYCKAPKFFPNLGYVCGITQTCDDCKRSFQHVTCYHCHQPCYYPNCDFRYGTEQKCQKCNDSFTLIMCPQCGKENYWNSGAHNRDFLLQRDCWNCQSNYYHHPCEICNEPLYLSDDAFILGINKFDCPKCKNKITFYKCRYCKKIYPNSTTCKQNCNPPPVLNQTNVTQRSSLFTSNNQNSLLFHHSNNNQNQTTSLFSGSDLGQFNGNQLNNHFSHLSEYFYPRSNTVSQLFDMRLNQFRYMMTYNPNQNTQSDIFNRAEGRLFGNQNNSNSNQGNRISPPRGGHLFGNPNNDRGNTGLSILGRPSQSSQNKPKILNVNEEEIKHAQNESKPAEPGKECVICIERPCEMALIPCGHKKFCIVCTDQLLQKKDKCPLCRSTIREAIKIYE